MKIDRLTLRQFRNYQQLTLDLSGSLHVFTGSNAQGKTNILEAIYLGAVGHSHRTAVDAEMIRWQQEAAAVEIEFTRRELEQKLAFRLIKGQNKEILYNGSAIKPREMMGILNVVMFSPEDLLLIKGAPVLRRRFLDTEISQADPGYYRRLTQYNRVLAQRNNLLKKIRESRANGDQLEPWDCQLAELAGAIVGKRQEAIKKLTMLANLMHRRITANQESLCIRYRQWGGPPQANAGSDWILERYRRNRQEDIFRGSTGLGPHRDDLELDINGINLRTYGSQGQQRTGVLALKLSELEFIRSETGEYPLLLLDDVMSELDVGRRGHLLSFIRDRIQTLITATELYYVPDWKSACYYAVSNGQVNRQER